MRSRLLIGVLRYGRLRQPGKPEYDRVGSMVKRLKRYQETGNKEMLVDVANFALLEFVECRHPLAHFLAVDDGDHVPVVDAETKEFTVVCACGWASSVQDTADAASMVGYLHAEKHTYSAKHRFSVIPGKVLLSAVL